MNDKLLSLKRRINDLRHAQTRSLAMLSMLLRRLLTVVTLTTIATVAASMTLEAQEVVKDIPQTATSVDWLTGKEIERFNKKAISAWWSNAEIKDRLIRFSETQRLAIFFDRRIDPSTMIDMTVQDVTKEQFLWSVAQKFDLGVCRIEDLYYFGPKDSAANLNAACDQLRKTTIKRRFKAVNWSHRNALKTEAIVQPSEILKQLATENQFRIVNPEAIPHDLWTGIDLPKTTLQVRVAMLLVGFGKTYKRNEDGSQIEIIDFPKFNEAEKTIRDVDGAARLAKRFRQDFPAVQIKVKSNRISVKGSPQDVATIEAMTVRAQVPKKPKTDAEKNITLERQATRGSFLATIANLKGKQLVFDKTNRELVKTLQERITIRVVNTRIGDVLQMTISETNLHFEIVEDELRISEN
jgi:hypothetical protein